jgi:hypothetical protein
MDIYNKSQFFREVKAVSSQFWAIIFIDEKWDHRQLFAWNDYYLLMLVSAEIVLILDTLLCQYKLLPSSIALLNLWLPISVNFRALVGSVEQTCCCREHVSGSSPFRNFTWVLETGRMHQHHRHQMLSRSGLCGSFILMSGVRCLIVLFFVLGVRLSFSCCLFHELFLNTYCLNHFWGIVMLVKASN